MIKKNPSLAYLNRLSVALSFPDHRGRPGERGGSLPRSGAGAGSGQNLPGFIKDDLNFVSSFKKFKSIEKPTITINEMGNNSMQFGRINIDATAGPKKRVGETFVHEYAHYADYRLSITENGEFDDAFSKSQERAKGMSVQDGSAIGFSHNALMGGKKGSQWHSAEYFKNISNADKKEFFAISLSAYVYYDPKYFQAFPEMLEYMKSLE